MDEPVPANDWMISVASTTLLFICLNVTIVVEIYKNFHEIGLLRKVNEMNVFSNYLAMLKVSVECKILLFIFKTQIRF